MKRIFRNYQDKLIKDLQDPEIASAYVNEALDDEDPRLLLLALQNIKKAVCKGLRTKKYETKSFDDFIKTKLSEKQLDEIKKKAQLEVEIIKVTYKKNKKLRRQFIRSVQRSRRNI